MDILKKKQPIIELKDICYAYPGSPPVLDNLNFTLCQKDKIGLVAPNGSGKTTLFHVIMGLLKPSSGRIEIFGKPVLKEKDFRDVRRRIGLLFQDADDQLFSPTVIEDVAFGPLNLGKSSREAIEISRKTLAFLGMSEFEDRITFKLSGGEKRMISLATVLAMEPEVLLLDEPTTGLDTATRQTLAKVLEALDMSLVLISHNADFLEATTHTLYSMENGRILTDEQVHFHYHYHAHTRGTIPHKHKEQP
jgi:cobalt/nickel transport system ATP-binding protein